MFRCGKCGRQTEPREGAQHLIVEKREKEYQLAEGEISRGWEIVKEILICKPCAQPDELDRDSVNREIPPATGKSAISFRAMLASGEIRRGRVEAR